MSSSPRFVYRIPFFSFFSRKYSVFSISFLDESDLVVCIPVYPYYHVTFCSSNDVSVVIRASRPIVPPSLFLISRLLSSRGDSWKIIITRSGQYPMRAREWMYALQITSGIAVK